jgi:hypothetical protein
MNKMDTQQILSNWIPVSIPPVIEGIYEVKDNRVIGGYQRFKAGTWGTYRVTVKEVAKDSYHYNSVHCQPTHWRGVIDL